MTENFPVEYGEKDSFWVDYGQLVDVSRLQHLNDPSPGSPGPDQLDIPVNGDKSIRISPKSSALIIIDMQNYFLHPDLRMHPTGLACIEPLLKVITELRTVGVKILWVNWGLTESEIIGLPPALLRGFSRGSTGSFGRDLGNGFGRLLMRGERNSALYGPLQEAFTQGLLDGTDAWVHKNRISGLWDKDTDLNVVLKKDKLHTLFFAGVNADQCVLGTLMDAYFQHYSCVLVNDITATSSPSFLLPLENVVYNTARSYGFVTDTSRIIEAAKAQNVHGSVHPA